MLYIAQNLLEDHVKEIKFGSENGLITYDEARILFKREFKKAKEEREKAEMMIEEAKKEQEKAELANEKVEMKAKMLNAKIMEFLSIDDICEEKKVDMKNDQEFVCVCNLNK